MRICTNCNNNTFNETLNKCMNPGCKSLTAPISTATLSPPKPVVTDFTRGGSPLINPPKFKEAISKAWQPKPEDNSPVFATTKPTQSITATKVSSPSSTSGGTGTQKPLTWKEKEAAKKRETEERQLEEQRKEKEMVDEIMRKYPTRVVVQPADGDTTYFFRTTGAGQEPWDVLAAQGFQHRYWKTGNVEELKAKLRGIYGVRNKGAEEYMTAYRGNPNVNPAEAPFVSFGKSADGGQGASKNDWHFSIEVRGLQTVAVTPLLLGMAATDFQQLTNMESKKVDLLTDTGDLDTANVVLLLHGPMPEATFLNSCPLRFIKAWKRLTGKPWQRHWRAFDEMTINGIVNIAKDYKIQIGVA